jgi:hypothetical protein
MYRTLNVNEIHICYLGLLVDRLFGPIFSVYIQMSGRRGAPGHCAMGSGLHRIGEKTVPVDCCHLRS